MPDRLLHDLLLRQDGLLTLRQAADLGVSRSTVRWALGTRWTLVLPRVVHAGLGPLNLRQRMVAALLYAGPGSLVASLTAAEWHGVTSAADPLVHVLAPASTHPRSTGFVAVRRTHRPDLTPWQREPLTISSRPRSVIDAARDAGSAEQATAIVCEAVERRLVPVRTLRHELEAGARGGSAIVRGAIEAAEAGAWSVAEGDLYRLTRRSAVLTPMWLNPTLRGPDGVRLPTPDGWFDAVALAVQVHSRRWHGSGAAWDATVMSDGVFAEYGVPVVGVTPHALTHAPGQVLERLERAHRAAAERPRPRVDALPGGAAELGALPGTGTG